MPETDDIAQLADEIELEIEDETPQPSYVSSVADDDAPPPRRRHVSPLDPEIRNHEWALDINEFLDGLDPSEEGDLMHRPATKLRTGQCLIATSAELTESGPDIHPAWLAGASLVAYGTAVGLHWFFASRRPPDVADRREEGREARRRRRQHEARAGDQDLEEDDSPFADLE